MMTPSIIDSTPITDASRTGLQVISTGTMALVEDFGRPGLASMGVGKSGAADVGSMRLANRLVGNHEDAACIEVTFGGLEFRALFDLTIAVTGAPAPIDVDGRKEPCNAVIAVRSGQRLRLGFPTCGVRSYVAIRGGIDVMPELGSRSADIMANIGPAPLAPGMTLDVASAPAAFPLVDIAPIASMNDGDILLHARPGPRDDWFTKQALDALWAGPFVVTTNSNRVGMRLDGPPLTRRDDRELLSEGVVMGSLQAPPSGHLTLFLADHPVTGGYPVIAVVLSRDIDKAAQARPGQRLFFRCSE